MFKEGISKLTNLENYSKKNGLLFLIGLAVLLFWQQVIGLYNKYIVSEILCKIQSGFVADIAFLVVGLVIILFFVSKAKINYQLPIMQRLLFVTPAIIYLIILWYNATRYLHLWKFESFRMLSAVRYADIILLMPLCYLLAFAYQKFATNSTLLSGGYLQKDMPIDSAEEDVLNRLSLASRVAKQIKTISSKSSFAIGIVGKWGTGKSSFIKLIESDLQENNIIIIHFNPWLVESTAAIRKDFFNTLKESVSKYSGELANEITTYANGLAGVYDNTATKLVKEAVSIFSETQTLTEQFKTVNEVIADINKRIIIFVDDIDRLDKDEVMETLRIVRNTASFNNTVFVLAYDKQYVINAIKITNQTNSNHYLDKIVQLEISLPNFNLSVLSRRTFEILKKTVPVLYHTELEELIVGKLSSKPVKSFLQHYSQNMDYDFKRISFYDNVIDTMRSAIRFANLFTFDCLPLLGEARLDEMVNLTLIKFRFPTLYEAIKSKEVVEADYDFGSSFDTGNVIKLNEAGLLDYYKANETDRRDKEIIDKILKHMFGGEKIAPIERTIQRPSSFDIYFSAGGFENVSLLKIEELRLGDKASVDKHLNDWYTKKHLEEAFEVLTSIKDFNDRKDFENVVTAVFKSGNILDKGISAWLFSINENVDNITKSFYSGDNAAFKQLFLDCFNKAHEPYLYESGLAEDIKAKLWRDKSYQFFLSKDELDEITLNYLTAYTAVNKKFDINMYSLYWNNASDVDENNYIIINKEANEPFKQAILIDTEGVLSELVIPDRNPPDGKHFVFRPFLNQVFGSWEGVDNFIANGLPTSEAAQNVQADYALLKANGYSSFERLGIVS